MVVPIVHEDCILSFERESEPPISTHAHRPMSIQIAFEKVPLPPGKVHLFRPSGGVQREKLIGESLCMRGLDPNLEPVRKNFSIPLCRKLRIILMYRTA